MSRPVRIIRNLGVAIAALVLLVSLAAFFVVRTEWFRNFVRQKIVTATEDATGGRVEIGSFSFDWTHLTATVTNFVVHGTEPADAAPYLRAARVELRLHLLHITYLAIDQPQANILVAADGTTNIPKPKTVASNSTTTPLQTVVNLAVGHFQLTNGCFTMNSRQQNFDISGDSLRVQLWYNALQQGYKGEVSLTAHYGVKALITLPVTLDSNRISLQNASIVTNRSQLLIDGSLSNLNDPSTSAHIRGHIALADLPISFDTHGLPKAADLDVNASMAGNQIDLAESRITYGASTFHAAGKLSDGSLRFQAQLALQELDPPQHGTVDASGAAKLDLQARRLDLSALRIDALGGEVTGSATLEDFARYSVHANLAHFDLRRFGYGGNVSGPLSASGDLHIPGMKSLTADARLSIAPARQGVPLSGRIFADYRGDSDNLTVRDSYVTLPHTKLTVAGSIGNRLTVGLTTTDLGDFTPLTGAPLPVVLQGKADFEGTVTGRLTSPQIAGHLAVDRFAVEGRPFDGLAGDIAASESQIALTNASLRRGNMTADLSATSGLHLWAPTQNQPLTVRASIRNGDLADVLALAGISPAGYSGALTADVNVAGTIGDPRGSAKFSILPGTLDGEQFDATQSRVDLTAEFQPPRDRQARAQLQAHLAGNLRPASGGTVQATADATGQLTDTFVPVSVSADASGRGLRDYGDFTATARTSGQSVTYNVTSNFSGSHIRVNGNTSLAADHHTTADADIAGLPIAPVLSLLKRTDIPAKGTLTATAHVSGTLEHPEGTVDATVDKGVFDEEPIDHVHVRATYLATGIDVPQLEIRAGTSTLDGTAHYERTGELKFRITNGHLDLAHIRHLQNIKPGVSGTVQLTADGASLINGSQVLPRDINLNLSGKSLALQDQSLGDLTLVANTAGGRVNFTLGSNLAGASIQGKGNAQLGGDYPLSAQLTVHNLNWASGDFHAAADGEMTLNGPVLKTDAMTGRLQFSRVQLTGTTEGRHAETVTVQNQGPVTVALDHGVARIESLHLTGPQTDVQAHGSVSIAAQTMQASFTANTDLGLLQKFDRDVISSGQITADATLRGTFSDPLINGKLQLHNASVNLLDVTTGLSNANGEVDFNGSSASFKNLTGEVGGGPVTLSGFLAYSGATRMALRVNARNVRIRLQPGVSAVADADLHLSGRPYASIASGTVTINRITYAPQSDIGAILSRAAPATQTPATPSPLLDNMKMDIQVRTSPSSTVRASVAQSLQADANLHVQGTASQPGITGRIAISEGKLVFMSSTYSVNSGTIAFYNPIRIEPILDLSLQTQAQGVDVTLRVTGPIDNMKLSYTSNPPLQFQEVVALLAAGQTPTSDPNLLANQPTQPPQSFQEMGESAVVSQALADPIASRLQRVFGITQFKIDPTFANGQGLPQAQFSLQQQVTSRITLSYSTPVQAGGAESVSGQYLINREWSATATRDQFGLFSVKLVYQRQFK